MKQPAYKLIITGPQGSGKGTQAELLSKRLDIPTLSMGQLLRDEVSKGTAIGTRIAQTLKRGELVPEEITYEILKQRLAGPSAKNGYILDGFPRNMKQYEMFTFDTPTHVIVLEIPREESMRRITARLTCSVCGKIYNMRDAHGHKPGDACACGGTMEHREDDNPKSVERRLNIYNAETSRVIDAYDKRALAHRVDGVGTIEEVHGRIMEALKLSHAGCDHPEAGKWPDEMQ